PTCLSVARPDDPILGRIVRGRTGHGVQELTFGSDSVLGMNARNPILMGLVGGARLQPVDRQIFRRSTISVTVAQVDLDSADTGDPVDERKLRLTGLQLPDQLVHVQCESCLSFFDSGRY